MKTDKVYAQHEENKTWANQISFYRDEVRIMEKRLGEIVSRNTSQDVLAQVEHFQNQLIIQKDQLDRLAHELNLDQDKLQAEVRKNPVAVDHRTVTDHGDIRESMATFERLFAELKAELYESLSKWL